jgi:predicted RNase H-like HicB family nuclease/uncharacterized protein (DUF1778 family)
MLYPVLVHKDKGSAYGVMVPDFPGCFAAAETLDDLPAAVQEAAELFFHEEEFEVPAPGDAEAYLAGDPGATLIFVDINTDKLSTKKERVNLTAPVYALREIDEYVKAHGTNRSKFVFSAALSAVREANRVVTQPTGTTRFKEVRVLRSRKAKRKKIEAA